MTFIDLTDLIFFAIYLFFVLKARKTFQRLFGTQSMMKCWQKNWWRVQTTGFLGASDDSPDFKMQLSTRRLNLMQRALRIRLLRHGTQHKKRRVGSYYQFSNFKSNSFKNGKGAFWILPHSGRQTSDCSSDKAKHSGINIMYFSTLLSGNKLWWIFRA